MKQRGIGENPIEALRRQVELQEVLFPHFAPGGGARHGSERSGTFEPDGEMAELCERREVAAGTAAEIENAKWGRGVDVRKQRIDILPDVVAARAFTERVGALRVTLERRG